MDIVELVMANFKVAIGILAIVGFIVFDKLKGKKAYCYIRIKEKRGNTFVDHGKTYKASLQSVIDKENGRKLEWLHIDKLNRNWKTPSGNDFTPNIKSQRLVEMIWFGGNRFQVLKVSPFIYKKQLNGLYKKQRADEHSLEIIPDDLKLLDYEITQKIDALTTKQNWFDQYVKPHMVLIIVALGCVMMVYVVADKVTKELGETREEMGNLGDKFINFVQDRTTTKVDDRTTKKTDIEPEGGG